MQFQLLLKDDEPMEDVIVDSAESYAALKQRMPDLDSRYFTYVNDGCPAGRRFVDTYCVDIELRGLRLYAPVAKGKWLEREFNGHSS